MTRALSVQPARATKPAWGPRASPSVRITPTQAAASTLAYAPYAAASGVKSYGVGLSIVSPISGPWGVAAIANVNRLTGDAEDSPIVADHGAATQFNAGVFLSYRF